MLEHKRRIIMKRRLSPISILENGMKTCRPDIVRTIILISFAVGLLLAAARASAQPAPDAGNGGFSLEPVKLPLVIERVVKRLDQATANRGSRLAVATFVSTGTTQNGKGEFGEYFSETLASAIRSLIPRARLYERKRIDLILTENQFNLSDLVDEKQALRIGELVPVDTLLVGTYTAFDTYIDVNLRLVDISTGQILFSETDRIAMDKDLAALIARERGGAEASAAANAGKTDPCAETQKKIDALLGDLSSPDKVKELVKTASAVPFDLPCGKFHFDVIATLKRYKIWNDDYRRFLLSQLAGIPFPSHDDRAYTIFGYFAADGRIDDEEWKAGLETVQRAQARSISSLLAVLLMTRSDAPKNEEYYRTVQGRIGQVIALTEQGKIGLPVPLTRDQIFAELLDAFNYLYTTDNRVVSWLYETLSPKLSRDDQTRSKVWGLLGTMYPRENDPARKRKFLDWVIEYFKNAPADGPTAVQFFAFVKGFEVTDYKKAHPEELKKYPADHFTELLRHPDLFRTFTPLTKFPGELEDRIDICLENGIDIPGVVPTPEEAAAMLKSEEWNKRLRASAMLVKMGPKAAPAENALVSLFDDDEGGTGAQVAVFRNNVAAILGNIKTNKPKSLELLLAALDSRDYGVSETAVKSLGMIGAAAVPYLIRGLRSDEGGVQYKSASALAKIGPPAKAALPELKELAKSTNKDLHSIAVKAIAAIGGE
jgi:hypothetical protein